MFVEIKILPRKNEGTAKNSGNPPRALVLKCDGCGSLFEKKWLKETYEAKRHYCKIQCHYASRGGIGGNGAEVLETSCLVSRNTLAMVTPKKTRKKRKRRGHYQRGEYTSSKTGQVCKFRSGWEERYMVHLDSDPTVVLWTYEQTVIEYLSNIRTKKIRRYYPDFYVKYQDGREEILEVKPKRKLEQATVKKKAEAARQWCSDRGMTYRILTEIELKNIGLL